MDAVDGLEAIAEQLTPMAELGGHGLHALARSGHRRQGPVLGEGADIAGALALQGTRGLEGCAVAGQPADPPARHRPALGEAIHREDPIGQVRGNGREAVVTVARGQQEFVDLVADHGHLGMAAKHIGDRFEVAAAEHRAGGVAGAVEDQQLARWRDRRFQSLGIQPEAFGGGARDQANRGPSQPGHLRVAQPVGSGEQQLIAGLQQHLKEVVERLFAPVGHQDLVRARGDLVLLGQFLGDGLPQGRFAGGGAVAGQTALKGLGRGLADEGRGIEIRFAGAQAADVPSVGLQGLGAGRDRQRQRGLQRLGPGGEFQRARHSSSDVRG